MRVAEKERWIRSVRISTAVIGPMAVQALNVLLRTGGSSGLVGVNKGWITVNKLLKSLLKTAIYVMDQFFEKADRASDRVSDLTDRGRTMIHHQENRTLRNVASFAAGVGVGIGVGVLFAPASGKEIRSSISEKVHDISDQVRERVVPTDVRPRPSGTEPL